jgi:hypothetical protein
MYLGEKTDCCCNGKSSHATGLGLGPLVIPAVAAAGSLASSLTSIFKGKPPTMSPWGFPVGDYAARILDNEKTLVKMQTYVDQLLKRAPRSYPANPWPIDPATATPSPADIIGGGCKYGGIPCSNWAAAVRPIVARYSTQADCVTNNNQVNPGGCYEQTYAGQLQNIDAMKTQVANAEAMGIAIGTNPSPGSPTYNPQVPGNFVIGVNPGTPAPAVMPSQPVPQPVYNYPAIIPQYPGAAYPGVTPYLPAPTSPIQYLPSTGSAPNITISNPGMPSSSAAPATQTASMGNILLIGAGALALLMIMMAPKSSGKKAA